MEEETSTQTTNENTTVHDGPSEGSWSYDENTVGAGERPEWFKDKYSTVSAQAQAYNELEKRFGGFSGSPEEYSFKEGSELKPDSDLLKGLAELGKTNNMSNEMFNEIATMFNSNFESMFDNAQQTEIKELGDEAQTRITNVQDWAKANVPEELQEHFNSTIQTANDVKLAEHFMNMGKEQKMAGNAPIEQAHTSREELEKMQFEVDRYGNRRLSVEPAFKAEFEKKMAAFHNK